MLSKATKQILRRTQLQTLIINKSETDPSKFNTFGQKYSSFVDSIIAHNQPIWDASSEYKKQKVRLVIEALKTMTDEEKMYLDYLKTKNNFSTVVNQGLKNSNESNWKIKIFKSDTNCFDDLQEELSISKFLNSGSKTQTTTSDATQATETAEAEPEQVEEVKAQTKFTVKLIEVPAAKKLVTIKEVKAMLGIGLKDAKDMVETLPAEIKKDIDTEEVEKLKEKFAALGCSVEVV
jgi:ribosomal protein L7/L12